MVTENRFSALQTGGENNNKKWKNKPMKKIPEPQLKKKILCAVSYGKYMAFNLNKTIKHTQEADGFVKPDGQTHQVLTRPQI